MTVELNDSRVVDDIIDRWCRRLLEQINTYVDEAKAVVAQWEPRPCPPVCPDPPRRLGRVG